MALVLPRTRPPAGTGYEPISDAELDVLTALEKLPDHWIILHSLWLKTHSFKVHAQADFVVLADDCALIIEAKGGEVWRDDDGWHFRTKSGSRENVKPEGPLDQARGAYYAIRSHLETLGRRDLFDDHVWGYGAVFPECVHRRDPRDAATDPELILDLNGFPSGLADFIERLSRYWKSRLAGDTHHPGRRSDGTRPLSASRKREICEFVRPEMEKVVGVGVEVASSERELIRLTETQLTALDFGSAEPRNVFIGSAGTGKTVLAIEQARRMSESGLRVLFVCFNSLLAGRVRLDMERKQMKSVVAMNYHQLAIDLLKRSGRRIPFMADWGAFESWLKESLVEVVADLRESERFDYLVVDEAQDLMSSAFMELLDCLVSGGLRDGRWLMAIDTQQAIFRKNFDHELYGALSKLGKKTSLEINCRNTRPIAAYVRGMTGAGSVSTRAATGEMPVVRYFSDAASYRRLLKKVVNDLVSSFVDAGLPSSEIVLLTAEHSWLPEDVLAPGFFLRSVRQVEESDAEGNYLRYATIQAFKGLEARAVVLVGFDNFDFEASRELFYVGASRARGALRILLPEKCDHMQRAMPEIAKHLHASATAG